MSEERTSQDADVFNNIMSWRIYDALTLILRNLNPDEADAMVATHERGLFITDPPRYTVQED